jgi:hypothetical protein
MKRIYKTKSMRRVLPVLLLMCIITPGIVWSAEVEQVSAGPFTAAFAVMVLGQSKTYTVESEFPAIMIIPVVIYGTGNLMISVSKTDTSGEVFGVMQVGGYSQIQIGTQYGATVGVTPRSITLATRFYDTGFIVVMSGLLASLEEGPHRYSINLNAF